MKSIVKLLNNKYILLLLPFSVYLFHAWLFKKWIIDDAAISFVYARNLADGFGLVAQPGTTAVEGFSNPLWVFMMVPFYLLKVFDPIVTPKVIAFVLVAISYWVVSDTFKNVENMSKLILFGLILVSLNTSFVTWTISGLENPLYLLLIVTLFRLIYMQIYRDLLDYRLTSATGFTTGLIALTRPDGIVFSVIFILLAGWFIFQKRFAWKNMITHICLYLVALGVVYGGYLMFRYFYFGDLLPNTYLVKGGPTIETVLRILTFAPEIREKLLSLVSGLIISNNLLTSLLIFSFFFIVVFLLKTRKFTAELTLLLLFLLTSLFIYLLLPLDWMPEFRFATPFIFFVYLFGFMTLNGVIESLQLNAKHCGTISIIGIYILIACSFSIYIPRTKAMIEKPVASLESVAGYFGYGYNYFAERLKIDYNQASILVPDVGGAYYYSKMKVYDLGGLTDKTIAETLGKDSERLHNYVFDEIKPTLIHTHQWFTYAANLNADPRFREQYVPIVEKEDQWVKEIYGVSMMSGDYVRKDAIIGNEMELNLLRQELRNK